MNVEKEYKKILIILFLVILFNFNLLPINYPTDIYNILEIGFAEYAKQWFAPAGRLVGLILFFVLDKTIISVNMYIVIMKFLSIIISSISIYIFYKTLIQLDKDASKLKKNIYLLASAATLLNRSTYQFFYYTESAIMWLGVLFVILALKNLVQNEKKYLRTSIYLFIAMNCYQAVILFYLPVAIILVGVKANTIKKFFVDIIKNGIIVLINLLLGYGILKILTFYYNAKAFRSTEFVLTFDLILNNFYYIYSVFCDGAHNLNLSYIYTTIIVLSLFLSPNILNLNKRVSILSIWLAITISMLEVVGIISTINFYCGDRIQFAYVSMVGVSLVYFLLYLNTDKEKAINILILIFTIIYLAFNIWNANDITKWHRIVRERDENILNTINLKVAEYEKLQGIEITRVEYCYDKNYVRCDYDIRETKESTQRILASEWVVENAIKYTLDSEVVVEENLEIYSTVFQEKEWDTFNIDEQIKFKENIMYYCIY